MFCNSVKHLFLKSQTISLNYAKRHLNQRYLREQLMKKELKLQSIQEFVIKRHIETNGDIDWKQMISELSEQKLVFRQNFEMDLMSAFLMNDGNDCHKVDQKLFESMVGLIRGLPIIAANGIAVSRYCHFISHFNGYLNESDIQLIRRTADQSIDKYLENKITHEVISDCMKALAKSSKDNCLHSIKLLDQIEKIDPKVILSLIDSSLEFKLIDESLNLINRYSTLNLSNEMIAKTIDLLLELNPSFDKTIDILKTFGKYLIVFENDLKTKIIEIMNRFSYKSFNTSIGRNGVCLKCDQTLKGLSTEEQKALVKQFRSVLLSKDNDLMMASFPEYQREYKNFELFIRKITAKKPLDLVIDGLNIAFATSAEIVEDPKNLRNYVQKYNKEAIDKNAVEILLRNRVLERYENILIIGRKHMKSWKVLNNLIERERDRISMFYAMNKTRDDLYILLAALQNPNTYIISSDFFREYSEKMSKDFFFKRWLTSHQILIHERKDFVYPDHFDHKIHISFDKRLIHIPFHNTTTMRTEWICCQKK